MYKAINFILIDLQVHKLVLIFLVLIISSLFFFLISVDNGIPKCLAFIQVSLIIILGIWVT